MEMIYEDDVYLNIEEGTYLFSIDDDVVSNDVNKIIAFINEIEDNNTL